MVLGEVLGGPGRVPGGSSKSFGQVSAGSRREDEDKIAMRRDLEPFWHPLGPSWGELGAILGRLGAILGQLGAVLGPSWGRLGAILGHLGAILGPAWAILSDLKGKKRYAQKPTKTKRKLRFLDSRRLPRWLQNGILADFSPLRRHLGATCRQHGGQDGNLEATWPNLGRTGAVLGGSWEVWGDPGEVWRVLGAVKSSVGAVKGAVGAVKGDVHGPARRNARPLWKTKSSEKRSLQKSKVV